MRNRSTPRLTGREVRAILFVAGIAFAFAVLIAAGVAVGWRLGMN